MRGHFGRSPELVELHEKLREQLLGFVDTITNSDAPNQEKTVDLLSVIAEQIIEARFCLEEIKNKIG